MFYITGCNNKTQVQGLIKNLLGLFLFLIFLTLTSASFAQEKFYKNVASQGNDEQRTSAYHSSFSHLNNEQLIERAHRLRSKDIDTTQQQLNYQWLQAYHNDDHILGKKVYQTIFKRGFKEFWNRQRKERFKSDHVPDADGRGSVSSEVDYKVRLTSDELKFKLSYEF